MTAEFNQQLMPQSSVDIDEMGQFALEAWNDDGMYYYLVVRTLLGTTTIATCGPVVPDVELLPSGFSMTLDKMPYKEDKLAKTINFWLNGKDKKLTNAVTIKPEDAIENFRDLKAYLQNYSEDNY